MRPELIVIAIATAGAGAEDAIRFERAGSLPVGPMAGLPEVADLNGDGTPDVLLACGPCCGMDPSPEAGHVQVLLGAGDGTLRYADHPVEAGPHALRVASADIDQDGALDIACIQHSSYNVTILFGRGDGTFEKRANSTWPLHDGQSPHVHSVALADVNGDRHIDLLATLVDDHALAVHLGDGRGGFAPAMAQPFFAQRHPYEQLAVIDYNADGAPDAIMTDVRGNGVTILLGSGTGMFAPSNGFSFNAHTPIELDERPMALALGDLNGDGRLDAVANIDEAPRLVILLGGADGRLKPAHGKPIAAPVSTNSVRLADFDGDGRLDVATGSAMERAVAILFGDGRGGFARPMRIDVPGAINSVAVADLNADGRPDLVVSSYGDGHVTTLLNRAP
ncbi:MAG: FG-GAP repeat domain-containing protein [Phycisphaerales bacterium JB039]